MSPAVTGDGDTRLLGLLVALMVMVVAFVVVARLGWAALGRVRVRRILAQASNPEPGVGDGAEASGVRSPSMGNLPADIRHVAARMHAGIPAQQAWSGAALRPDGVPQWIAQASVRPTWTAWWRGIRGKAPNLPSPRPRLRDVWSRDRPEASSMRQASASVVQACRFTHASGAPLAEILEAVAHGMDQQADVEQARHVARAGPTMSARVLAALPLLGVGLAAGVGAKPVELFTDGGIGTACLVLGVVFELAGIGVTWGMVRAASRTPDGPDTAHWCDLVRMGLDAGASVPDVLQTLGWAAGQPALEHAGRCLTLGVAWDVTWEQCVGAQRWADVEPLGQALRDAWEQGLAPDLLLDRAAHSIRRGRITAARESAETLAVRLVIPVAAFLLPAFLFMGVIPLLVRFLGASLGTLM